MRYDAKSGKFVPFLSGISADEVAVSKDGQWLVYVSYPDGLLWRSRLDGSERQRLSDPPLYALNPQWSPDGKQIVFYGPLQESPSRFIRFRRIAEAQSNWSVMTLALKPHLSILRMAPTSSSAAVLTTILQRSTYSISEVTKSLTCQTPRDISASLVTRWAIHCRPASDTLSIVLFDFRTRKWSELTRSPLGFPNWSADGKYIYFLRIPDEPAVLRCAQRSPRGAGGHPERLAPYRLLGFSLALAPDNSPLLLRNIGTQDIYSLDVDAAKWSTADGNSGK